MGGWERREGKKDDVICWQVGGNGGLCEEEGNE